MQVDGPVAPGFRGSTMFVRGISDEMRQRYRGQLFKVDRDGLVQVTSRLASSIPTSVTLAKNVHTKKVEYTV